MKKTILAAIVLAAFVCTNADARGGGGRGASGGRSVSARTYRAPAPKPKCNATVIQKKTTIINQRQTNVQNEGASNSSGFWSGVFGAAAGSMAGSMAGNLAYDALTEEDKQASPAPATETPPAQPQVIYVPVGPDGKPIQPKPQE